MWIRRGGGYKKINPPHSRLWQGPRYHFVAPNAFLHTLIRIVRGQDHCARGEVIRFNKHGDHRT